MEKELFVLSLAAISGIVLYFGFKHLPNERWQFIASFPISKSENDLWKGINLTYYGLIIACAQAFAIAIFITLTGSIGVSLAMIALVGFVLVCSCVLAAKMFARIVEKKKHTFTVGGASFLGILIAPAAIFAVYKISGVHDAFNFILPVLAAASISYTLGEGIGRLACISFGCCYGKPLKCSETVMNRLFSRYAFIFSGKTKKISYEAKLDGHKVIPVQAMTSIVFIVSGIVATYFFLVSRYGLAFGLTMLITQLWRIVSETMRADYRGQGNFSFYQIMALLNCSYSLLLSALLPEHTLEAVNLLKGFQYLWNPAVILSVQVLWFVMVVYFGKSTVTGSKIKFHINRELI